MCRAGGDLALVCTCLAASPCWGLLWLASLLVPPCTLPLYSPMLPLHKNFQQPPQVIFTIHTSLCCHHPALGVGVFPPCPLPLHILLHYCGYYYAVGALCGVVLAWRLAGAFPGSGWWLCCASSSRFCSARTLCGVPVCWGLLLGKIDPRPFDCCYMYGLLKVIKVD